MRITSSQRAQFLSVSRRSPRALKEDRLVPALPAAHRSPSRPDLPEHAEILHPHARANTATSSSPGVFIPAAERFNLMPQTRPLGGRPDLPHAVGDARHGTLYPVHEATIAVNLSGTTLSKRTTWRDYVSQLLQPQYAVDPARICFEITETAAVGSLEKAQAFIHRIHAMGATVALDDFGAGLSSFAYLRRLEVDYLKIDALFVRNLHSDMRDYAVVRSIMEVARVHGMQHHRRIRPQAGHRATSSRKWASTTPRASPCTSPKHCNTAPDAAGQRRPC
jgi:EAL domain-containing protein (putative c-di-GMP-specific phosphodiesterase class I)